MSNAEALLNGMLAHWFPQGADDVSDRLPGGDLNDVYRVMKNGRPFALRIYRALRQPLQFWQLSLLWTG